MAIAERLLQGFAAIKKDAIERNNGVSLVRSEITWARTEVERDPTNADHAIRTLAMFGQLPETDKQKILAGEKMILVDFRGNFGVK